MKSCRRIAALAVTLSVALIAQTTEATADLLSRLDAERDYAAKERLLLVVTTQDPQAGPALLRLAETAPDSDSRWLAMRGMATLHYADCAGFLEASLRDPDALIRANAARALSDLRITDASADLLAMFAAEKDLSALQQGSLALSVLGVKAAAPVLREKIPAYTGQTLIWLIGALGSLGDLSDVPLMAGFLDDRVAGETAAASMAGLTGIEFGKPLPMGLFGGDSRQLLGARAWWQSHKDAWPQCRDCHVSN